MKRDHKLTEYAEIKEAVISNYIKNVPTNTKKSEEDQEIL